MGIKNWTITAEGTKSASAREIYLHDKKHPNHKNTEGYLDVFGSADNTLNIIRNTERHKLETARKRKGGRPPQEATEFVLTFPKGIRPDKAQWKQILSDVMLDVADNIGVDRKELAPICRAVAHQQDQNPKKKGAGDHMHVMIGRFTNDGKYLRALQSKSTLHRMKQSFNVAALKVMGVNHATYEPVKTYQGKAKKRVPKWKADAGKAWVSVQNQHKRNVSNKKHLDQMSEQIKSEIEENKQLKSALDRFFNQAEKWLEAFKIEDSKQMNRQHNRLSKTIDDLGAFTMSDEDQQFIDRLTKQINSKSDKELPSIQQKKPSSGMKFR
ncbi:hypothetical protein F2K74_24905 [Vibrio parahaemolyticus]|nr:hypothetical protein [Vibrio parahaemolyticus]